jgi:hypothetical protein
MTHALIVLGSDHVLYQDAATTAHIARNDVDQELPATLEASYQRGIRDYRIINGPGSFTNLRVGCLLLNLLQSTTDEELVFHTIAKTDLYHFLYTEKILPRYVVMFIGQRKNCRWYDTSEQSYELLPIAALAEQTGDCVLDYVQGWDMDKPMMGFAYSADGVRMEISWQKYNLEKAPRSQGAHIDPAYIIQPQIG